MEDHAGTDIKTETKLHKQDWDGTFTTKLN